MAAAQLEHHLLARLVFDRAQLLQRDEPARFELVGRQMAAAEQVGVDRQRRRDRFSASVAPLKLVWLVETDSPRSTPRFSRSSMNWRLSRSPAPRRAISQVNELKPAAVGRIVHAAGRHEKREGGRFERLHRLGHQHQAVRITMSLDILRHGHFGGVIKATADERR